MGEGGWGGDEKGTGAGTRGRGGLAVDKPSNQEPGVSSSQVNTVLFLCSSPIEALVGQEAVGYEWAGRTGSWMDGRTEDEWTPVGKMGVWACTGMRPEEKQLDLTFALEGHLAVGWLSGLRQYPTHCLGQDRQWAWQTMALSTIQLDYHVLNPS